MKSSKYKKNPQNPPVVGAAQCDGFDKLSVNNITQVEVLKLIDTISMYKSSGMDNVNSRVLKVSI